MILTKLNIIQLFRITSLKYYWLKDGQIKFEFWYSMY